MADPITDPKEWVAEKIRDGFRDVLPDSVANSPLPEFLAGGVQLLFLGTAPTLAIGVVVVGLAKGVLAAFGIGADAVTAADIDLWRSGIRKTWLFLAEDYYWKNRSGYYIPDGLGRRTDAHQILFSGLPRNDANLTNEDALEYIVDSWCSHGHPTSDRQKAKTFLFFDALPEMDPCVAKRVFLSYIRPQDRWQELVDGMRDLRTAAELGQVHGGILNAIILRIRDITIVPPHIKLERIQDVCPELNLEPIKDADGIPVDPLPLCVIRVPAGTSIKWDSRMEDQPCAYVSEDWEPPPWNPADPEDPVIDPEDPADPEDPEVRDITTLLGPEWDIGIYTGKHPDRVPGRFLEPIRQPKRKAVDPRVKKAGQVVVAGLILSLIGSGG